MGVTASFTQQDISNYFFRATQIVHEEMIRTLSYLGEQAVKRVRDRSGEDSWFDRTGNLRSSVGYAVIDHGRKQIESAFEMVKNGTSGSSEGRKYIDELVSKYSNTYALLVVAGMNYAEDVEALENKDVLASTEIWARSVIDDYISKTKPRILNRIMKLSL